MRPEMTAQIAARQEILVELRQVLIDRMHLDREPVEVDPDAPLFSAGLALDSIDAVELVVCLEAMFGVQLNDADLLRQQMRTLNTLVDLVLAHRQGHVTAR